MFRRFSVKLLEESRDDTSKQSATRARFEIKPPIADDYELLRVLSEGYITNIRVAGQLAKSTTLEVQVPDRVWVVTDDPQRHPLTKGLPVVITKLRDGMKVDREVDTPSMECIGTMIKRQLDWRKSQRKRPLYR